MDDAAGGRWAWAEVDLDAVVHNVGVMRELVAPAAVWAVVKADAYGHGVVPVASAVIGAGVAGLCVALVQEGVELRDAGIDVPILVLSEQPQSQLGDLIERRLIPTVYTDTAICALDAEVMRRGCGPYPVHLKIDTGMHRVGAAADDVGVLTDAIRTSGGLSLDGVFTHLAAADEPEHPANAAQLATFAGSLAANGLNECDMARHASNSAGAIAFPAARYTFVRCGIALYGITPGPGLSADHASVVERLRPAMSLKARVGFVKPIHPGDGVSYGLRFVAEEAMWVATVPVGYADGVPRSLAFHGGEVLIGGVRRRILGAVTMDQIVVAVEPGVRPGDEVVLLGRQGGHEIRAEDWAQCTGTIGYEIVCGISARITRHHRGGGPRH